MTRSPFQGQLQPDNTDVRLVGDLGPPSGRWERPRLGRIRNGSFLKYLLKIGRAE
jgi:hypothetical protein